MSADLRGSERTPPIFRLLRALRSCRPRDFIVLFVVSPVLGAIAVFGPGLRKVLNGDESGDLLRRLFQTVDFGVTSLLLFLIGAICALMSARLRQWAGTLVMLAVIVLMTMDASRHPADYNMFPLDVALYIAQGTLAVLGGLVAARVARAKTGTSARD